MSEGVNVLVLNFDPSVFTAAAAAAAAGRLSPTATLPLSSVNSAVDASHVSLNVDGTGSKTMSTSDAAQRRRARAHTPPRAGAHTAATAGQENCNEIPTGEDSPLSISPERLHTVTLAAERLRQKEVLHAGNSTAHIHNPRYTVSLYLKLSRSLSLLRPEPRPQELPDVCPLSSSESLFEAADDSSAQVNGQASLPDVASDSPLSPTSDLSITATDNFRQPGHEGLCTYPHGSRSRETVHASFELEEHPKDQTDVKKLSDTSVNMLSSAVLTVLPPHWSSRLRRTKKLEGTGPSETQENFQDLANARNQHDREMYVLTDTSQAQPRLSFQGARRNTAGWSTRSGPIGMDYESKRKVFPTVSSDVIPGRGDNRNTDAGPLSTATTVSPSHTILDPNYQKNNLHTHHELGHSSFCPKPTSSSLLLALRRLNSQSMDSNASPVLSEPLSCQPTERNEKPFTRHTSESLCNKNGTDRSNPLLASSSMSYRTISSRPLANHKERDTSKTSLFSCSPEKKVPPFPQHRTVNRTQSTLTSSRQTFPSRGLSESQENWSGFGESKNLLSDVSVSLAKPSPYTILRTQSLPRTALTSSSWWKKITQEGSSPRILGDRTNTTDKPNTPQVQSYSKNSDLASPSPTNQRFSCQFPSNTDEKNITQSIHRGIRTLGMKAQRGAEVFHQRNAEDSGDQEPNTPVKKRYVAGLQDEEQQKTQSLPGVPSGSKISQPTSQTLIHPNNLRKHEVSSSLSTANLTEMPSAVLNEKQSRGSKYKKDCAKTNDTSHSDFQSFTKQASLLDTTHGLDTQTISSKSPFMTQTLRACSVSSQTNPKSSFTASRGSRFPKTVAITPLGFERTYSPISMPFRPNTVTIPPKSQTSSKTNYSPVSTISSCTTTSHPTILTSASSPLHAPPISSALKCNPLTPPTTPVNSNPLYSETSSTKEGRAFYSQEKDPMKSHSLGHEKKMRRVTWEDSAKNSEAMAVERPGPSPIKTSCPSKTQQSIVAPSITSILRSPKTYTEMGKEGRYRSLSSDSANLVPRQWERSNQRPSNVMITDQGRSESVNQGRSLSVGSDTSNSVPLSLSSDFSHGYKVRYALPPYSTLMSTRSTRGETNNIPPRSAHVPKHTQSRCVSQSSMDSHTVANMTQSEPEQPPPSLIDLPRPLSTCSVSLQDKVRYDQNRQILLVNNRFHASPQSPQGEPTHSSTMTCVTETLVYSIKSRAETPKSPETFQQTTSTPMSLETTLSLQSNTSQTNVASSDPPCRTNQSSLETQSLDAKDCNRGAKEVLRGKSTEQGPKRSRLAVKKSASTPNPRLSRSESERVNKTNTRVDQVLNKLKQTFSTRRSDDDLSFPWKWRRASQTPSVTGSSDIGSVTDMTAESNKTQEDEERGRVLKVNGGRTEGADKRAQNIPSVAVDNSMAKDRLFILPDKTSPEHSKEKITCAGNLSGSKTRAHLTSQSPTTQPFDFHDGVRTREPLFCRDVSPSRSPSPPSGYPAQFKKSTSNPRSPFSPFSSLSPVSPGPSPDVTDDNVFYSPKMQRRRESSHCEPREGISLGGSRRSRASTGPPSAGPVQDQESSYADLKYGIEPRRMFSVSSVLSSRPSGPGRISTGSRFMSVGNLSDIGLTCGDAGKDLDQWSVAPYWKTNNSNTGSDHHMSNVHSDTSKMRSRSLPRSLTRCLSNWATEVCVSPTVPATTSKSARLWSPNMNKHFVWDTEGPLTPPPTPPLSPVSKPPCLPSAVVPDSSGEPTDSQSTRRHLPTRVNVSSLSTFEESSDSSSDTTTDDEYYLETDGDEDKETEL